MATVTKTSGRHSFHSKQIPNPAPREVVSEARSGPASAKTTPNFYQKARSAFLFYKFYKFRACNTLILHKIRRLKWGIATERWEIATERWEIATKSGIYGGNKSTYKSTHGKDNRSGRRSRL